MFDPVIHKRQSIRLKGNDYSKNGAYFITICSYKKEFIFSTVGAGLASAPHNRISIESKEPGKIIRKQWKKIPKRFDGVSIDDLIIMPNHIHGILFIGNDEYRVDARPTPTFGDIICAFKSECVTEFLNYIDKNNILSSCKIWQWNYHEHIIRNEKELEKYRKYIHENPLKWEDDKYYA